MSIHDFSAACQQLKNPQPAATSALTQGSFSDDPLAIPLCYTGIEASEDGTGAWASGRFSTRFSSALESMFTVATRDGDPLKTVINVRPMHTCTQHNLI